MAHAVPDAVNPREARRPQGKSLLIALFALLALTGLSWWSAHLPLGAFHAAAALGIAVLKACTVGLVFMELSRNILVPRFIALLTFLFIALLCAGLAGDALLR